MRIAIDMDEVIADPISKFIKLYNRDCGVLLDLVLDPGNEIYHHVPETVNMKWFDYINEIGFFRDLPVIPGAIEGIQKLQEQHDVYIVSAAMEFRNSLVDKYDWLAEHFPFISWQNIMFCGDKIIEADILIDDRIKNFKDFKGRPLLFSSPHNMLISGYERVDTWEQVLKAIL
jgi:5'(3')-deoxyribonucleotidase